MARKGNPISVKLDLNRSSDSSRFSEMALIRYFFPFLTFIASHFVFRFLGSEGTAIMTAGGNLVLFGIILMILTFLFRIYYCNLNKKSGFPLVFLISMMILFAISLLGCCLRTHLLSHLGAFFLVFFVGSGGGQPLPLPSPSSPSDEDSFGIQVLSEPWPVTQNLGFESSLRNRIRILETENCIFLLEKEKGEYWEEVQRQLENSPSQQEYNRLLEFENRDLQIRELRHTSYSEFKRVLTDQPALAETAAYNPDECFRDFLDDERSKLEHRSELEHPSELEHLSELEREVEISLMGDHKEIAFLNSLYEDLRQHGQNSVYVEIILGR